MTIGAFEATANARLGALRVNLLAGRYRPGPVLRLFLPKDDGGHRPLGIANVADRVVQTSMAQWLQRRVEPMFSPASYGYRSGMGPRRAAMFAGLCAQRAPFIVNADIERFFDNVDHQLLAGLLATVGVNTAGQALVLASLRATPLDRGQPLAAFKGLPQGSPVAPVLANLYLNEFDHRLTAQGLSHVRYADDFIIFTASAAQAAGALEDIRTYLSRERRLQLKATKTRMAPLSEGFEFVGFHFDSSGQGIDVRRQQKVKEEIARRLDRSGDTVGDIVRAVNDLVVGWRAYYGAVSHRATTELQSLDVWRRQECARFLEERHQPRTVVNLLFESFVPIGSAAAPLPGAYGQEHPRPLPATPALRPPTPAPSRARRPRDVVRSHAIGRDQMPTLSPRGDFVVPTLGAYVTTRGAAIVVTRKTATISEVPIDDVRQITLVAPALVVSTSLLIACTKRAIGVELIDRGGRPIGKFQPLKSAETSTVAIRQLKASRNRFGTRLAAQLISGKLRNQRALLLYHAKYAERDASVRVALKDAARRISDGIDQLKSLSGPLPAERTGIFLIEARAAALYWQSLAKLMPAAFTFPGRRGRGAQDPVNSLLNYGYWRLCSRVWRALDRVGLATWIKLLHSDRRSMPPLILDAMEEFRPSVVDRVVFGLLGRGFVPKQRSNGRLRLSSRQTLERALTKNLERKTARCPEGLEWEIRRQARRLRAAFENHAHYESSVMVW